MQHLPLTDLDQCLFDVVIIGAGINGAGAAQAIAAQGYRVLVIDKGDFASGATNRSSRILHCGLRHLAPGKSIWEFVRQPAKFLTACQNAKKSMLSRSQIAHTMQPLVKPFPFAFPIYANGPYAGWQMDLAFKLLKFLGPADLPLEYIRHSAKNLDKLPFSQYLANQKELKAMAVFRDYQFLSAERMVIDTLKDAHRMGANVRNYTECLSARKSAQYWQLELQDSHNPAQRQMVTTQLVINAGGPWGDQLTKRLTGMTSRRMVGLKGIHILVDLPEELAECGMMAINSENETLYCLPWQGMHYIGPTRTPYKDNLDSIVCSEKELDWMLAEVNQIFPKFNLTRQDVHYSYAGIQPVSTDARDTKGSREIRIHDLKDEGYPNMLMLTGGPIMTFRMVAAQLAEAVKQRIEPSAVAQPLSFLPDEVSLMMFNHDQKNNECILDEHIVQKIVAEEQVHNLTDLFFRRSQSGWSRDQGQQQLVQIADIVATALGWDKTRQQNEIDRYTRFIEENFPSYR